VRRKKQVKTPLLLAILKKNRKKADKKVAVGCMPQGATGC
jgi:hypothetical protein